MKRIITLLIAVILLIMTSGALSAQTPETVTLLFTHDLHSHFLPSWDEDGGQYGGYAGLMTAIKEQKQKYPDALLVDGGDFSMGSLFQTAYTTSALELRMMGDMGYDATTLGNHEFDYLQDGLASMLNAAKDMGTALPSIVMSNYTLPGDASPALIKAFDDYGVKEYIIIERGGVYYAVFGIYGIGAHESSPNSGMTLNDAATEAQRVRDAAVAECKEKYGQEPVVVCLSHSGVEEDGRGEDYDLAENTTGIDVIVSGHTHVTLEEPVKVNDTYIVSAGEYGRNLGVISLTKGSDGYTLFDYQLIPIDENVPMDAAIAERIEGYKSEIDNGYLSNTGFTYDQVILENEYTFESVKDLYATLHDSSLGNLFADAYRWAATLQTGERVDVALTASSVIRETIPVGRVTTADVFNAASLGVGTEGELVSVYVTGEDLINALEVDGSVQAIMPAAQLFFSGVEYSVNTGRMLFNRVHDAALVTNSGTQPIEKEKLYHVVTGMYAGQMLGTVKDKSFGLLNITPRDKEGNPLSAEDLFDHVIRDAGGNPVKEWHAIASYLSDMEGRMSDSYKEGDGRKNVYFSLAPAAMLKDANIFTYIAGTLLLVIIALIILIVVKVIRRKKKKTK